MIGNRLWLKAHALPTPPDTDGTKMNARFRTPAAASMATTLAPEFRIVTGPICGSLLGPEWIVAACDKYFRVGALTVGQLERGIPADEIDMLECTEDGEPL